MSHEMVQEDSRQPEISIDPYPIDFGLIIPDNFNRFPHFSFNIINNSDSIQKGKILPQQYFIQVTPEEFRIAAHASSKHFIKFIKKPPEYWTRNIFNIDNLFTIHMKNKRISVSGRYSISKPLRNPMTYLSQQWKLIIVGLIIVLVAAGIFRGAYFLNRKNFIENNGIENLYLTFGASTVFVNMTATSGAKIFQDQQFPTNSVNAQSLPTQLESSGTLSPNLPTLTALPLNVLPDPEQLIRIYYDHINKREYSQAWKMLTEFFRNNCCDIVIDDPFIVYSEWWNTVENVVVISTGIKDENANPLIIEVILQYSFKNGEILEQIYNFYMVTSIDNSTFLINEVYIQ